MQEFKDTVYLRNSETDLRVPLFKTANGQKSVAYCAAHLWNNLESEVKTAPSEPVFTNRLLYSSLPILFF